MVFRKSFTSGLMPNKQDSDDSSHLRDLNNDIAGNANDRKEKAMRSSSTSFFKANRNTAISSTESFRSMHLMVNSNTYNSSNVNESENNVSELISNNDQVMAGTPF